MAYEIRNDRLVIDGKPVRFVDVPHKSGARMEPRVLVYHDTAGSSMQSSLSWFLDPRSKVSAHLIIGRNRGEIVQCVEFDRVAWHAGPSEWQGLKNLNGCAIGIELDNIGGLDASGYSKANKRTYADSVAATGPRHSGKRWVPYTDWQLEALEGVTRALVAAYPRLMGCAGHWEIDTRGWKEDPTPLFPWERMRAAMGRPKLVTAAAHDDAQSIREAQAALNALGYGAGVVDGLMGPRTRGAIRTFQEQNGVAMTGALDEATWSRLFVTRDDLPAPKEMPLGTRAEMTTVRGSRTMLAASGVQWGVRAEGALEAGHALGDLGAHVTDAGSLVGQAEGAIALAERVGALVPTLERLWDWLQTPAGLKAAGVLLALVALDRAAAWIKRRRLADARSGRHL